jgi:hypothetical protein
MLRRLPNRARQHLARSLLLLKICGSAKILLQLLLDFARRPERVSQITPKLHVLLRDLIYRSRHAPA